MSPTASMTVDEAGRQLARWIATTPDDFQYSPKAQREALERYGKLFSPGNIDNITEEDFKAFLLGGNNRHWTGINRQQGKLIADMPRLRECLKILLDESRPIESRLDEIFPKDGAPFIKGLGKAVVTPILMCVYPEKYAVYNRVSETGLEMLSMFNAKRSDSLAKRYAAVNKSCHEIGQRIGQPLHLVDTMFDLIVRHSDEVAEEPEAMEVAPGPKLEFPLEKFLEEFLVANWNKTKLGEMLELYEEDQDVAEQYVTDVGRIDILAREKKTKGWVVVELKRGRDSDKVVGQLLRYMGWVKDKLAKADESVKGIIISGASDDRIKYAMSASRGITFFTYQVKFELIEEKSV